MNKDDVINFTQQTTTTTPLNQEVSGCRLFFGGQPRPFYMIFMLEIWERFGFYTVQGILVLYFVRSIGLSHREAYAIFGTFCALIYGLIPVGGYLGDKILGTKRTIVIGMVVLALGYALLACLDPRFLYIALALICVGAALFKSNPGVLLAQCYEKNSPKIHGAFTLYYMAINIGAMASLIVGPYVSRQYGYGYAYAIAALGILLGLLNYGLQYQVIANIETDADQQRVSLLKWVILGLGIWVSIAFCAHMLRHPLMAQNIILSVTAIFVVVYFVCVAKADKKDRPKLLLVFILMIEAVVFFTLYQQMPTSINVFAVHHVTPRLLGIALDPQSLQMLNPFWIIMLSPLLAMGYGHLNRHDFRFDIPYKFAAGMVFCSISFMILYLSRFMANDQGFVSSWWLVASYFFQALGELLVSALGLAMIAELVPMSIMGFVIGVWYLTSSVSGFTGAAVASMTALPKGISPDLNSLNLYTHVFLEIGITTFIAACCMGMMAPRLMRLMR